MIKRNNKGFTLLELLISIFILTTVVFLGYRVINKSTMDIKNQGNINQGQLTVNDMNEYLTKDLEQARSVVLTSNYNKIANTIVEDDSTKEEHQDNSLNNEELESNFFEYLDSKIEANFDYTYQIRSKDDENKGTYSISYNVEITKDKNNYKYSVSREEANGILISFIKNEVLNEQSLKVQKEDEEILPFKIGLNSPYEVFLGYNGKNNEFTKHEFTVTYRLNNIANDDNNSGNETDTIPPKQDPPIQVEDIVPPFNWGEYNTIGFWTADASKKENNNLYTWVSTNGKILKDVYANQDRTTEIFNIEGYARAGNNKNTGSYIGYNKMVEEGWSGQIIDVSIGEKAISEISIYLSPHTKLENFKIESTQGSTNIQTPAILKEGWNHCTVKSNNPVSFKFNGKLSIDKSKVNSGYAYVVYKREDSSSDGNTSDLRGDLIFEITKNNSQNTGQYNWEEIIKGNLVQNPVTGVQQSLTEFKDRPFHLYIGKHENKIRPAIDGMGYDIYNSKICNIVGMRVRLDGDIKLKFDNFYDKENNSILDNPQKVYEFELPNKDYNISGKIDILKNVPLYNTSRIIVDFIYK